MSVYSGSVCACVCVYLGSVWIQVSFTGGGTGADTVLVLTSPMMCSASLSA